MSFWGLVGTLLKVMVVVLGAMGSVVFWVWMERRLVARFQQRIGPNRVGPAGLLQPIADALKLLFKEDIIPAEADRALHLLAPALALVPALMALAIIPWAPDFFIADLDVGVLYLLALSSLGVYSLVIAGWASNNKYSLLGGVRSSAQMISYELSMGLALLSVALAAGTLRLTEMVRMQDAPWRMFLIWQFPAFLIFLICAIAETNRAPFDLPEAESELVAGYHTEYSGFRFAMFYMSEYVNMLTASAVIASVFLGGWQGPLVGLGEGATGWGLLLRNALGFLWMAAKILLLMFFFMWLRATLPRLRYDMLMQLGWKVLLPTALGWALATALLTLAGFYRWVYG